MFRKPKLTTSPELPWCCPSISRRPGTWTVWWSSSGRWSPQASSQSRTGCPTSPGSSATSRHWSPSRTATTRSSHHRNWDIAYRQTITTSLSTSDLTFCDEQEENEAREEDETNKSIEQIKEINQEQQNLNKSKQEIEMKIKVLNFLPLSYFLKLKRKESGGAEIWGTRSHQKEATRQ